jgi:hypothetical protein
MRERKNEDGPVKVLAQIALMMDDGNLPREPLPKIMDVYRRAFEMGLTPRDKFEVSLREAMASDGTLIMRENAP